MVIGALFVLWMQGHRKACVAFWLLTLYEGVMFAIFKGWL